MVERKFVKLPYILWSVAIKHFCRGRFICIVPCELGKYKKRIQHVCSSASSGNC